MGGQQTASLTQELCNVFKAEKVKFSHAGAMGEQQLTTDLTQELGTVLKSVFGKQLN